ncbi:MAG TPA: anaerobic ribonucleoside-triphosphate reductase [Candidatus Wujingus californicus]|uniref:anaerobic ribonucleoside-triphosphate reductase n=1 Tax=Candidatus Wujingus californicus TaxID=3367618 RepID=UPI001D9D8BF9|nr:anaerobic ribonucleoside-triphosphate reductase [Planctomycetota bacterium]MDO8131794.1 anaerobic ribonucleoside-triphosphate reductase [Candidatus Brocadiales bacterium]
MNTTATIEYVLKRDGRKAPFNEKKIADAIFRAAQAVGGEDRALAEELAGVVAMFLEKKYSGKTPGIEDVQDIVEKILIETGHAKTAKAYILYRDKRTRIRESLRVRKQTKQKADTTDVSLLVNTETKDEVYPWDKRKIATAMEKEADIPEEIASEIANVVEQRVFSSGLTRISTTLIRELVDNELFERGLNKKLEKQTVIGIPKYDLEELILSKNKENSNIATNNPEAINLAIAENTLKQFALQEVFSKDVASAHLNGILHLHDLGYPTRVYCSSHSLEYLKKYGLSLQNLDTESAPAKHARTLTGHLNTFLASMQAYYAGALGVGYINIMYAPYIEGMSYKEMKQEAQHLIFSCSQSAFSRGGQTLFLDFNIHTGVPKYLRNIPAIGPSGKPTGKTYGDYADTARQFTLAMLDVWREGDCYRHPFAFPKCDFHINEDTLNDPKQYELLEYACQIASENGVPYFIFDRDEITLSACCRLRTTITDNYMIQHPESMRFCGFQNITINLPQAAYRAGRGNWDALLKEIDKAIEIAVKAHLQKKLFVEKLMSSPEMPLWEIGKKAKDGRPYVDLETSTYIVGILGLNECLQFMTGRELHEGEDMIREGLRIIAHMYMRVKEAGKKYNLKFSLEESPAESASRRLAKVDVRNYPEAAEIVKGNIEKDEFYYTNSIHLRPDAPVDMITRIFLQSKFHTMIESGAIIHAFVGEERPPASSIMNLVKKTFKNTQAAQVTISPEFTICSDCKKVTQKLTDICKYCGSRNVYGITRIVGYYSRINNWNKSKIGELADRHKGNYSLKDLLPKKVNVSAEPCASKC